MRRMVYLSKLLANELQPTKEVRIYLLCYNHKTDIQSMHKNSFTTTSELQVHSALFDKMCACVSLDTLTYTAYSNNLGSAN